MDFDIIDHIAYNLYEAEVNQVNKKILNDNIYYSIYGLCTRFEFISNKKNFKSYYKLALQVLRKEKLKKIL